MMSSERRELHAEPILPTYVLSTDPFPTMIRGREILKILLQMVVILQQTMDNGGRFVSTVVEEEGSYTTSNFSLASQNSISERSAIYKQRIDSLFGRRTRLSPFKPNLGQPFSVRIPGKTGPTMAQPPLPPPPKFGDNDCPEFSEDEEYQRIREDKTESGVLVADSLNSPSPPPALHVSSVKVNCEESDPGAQTNMVYSLSDEGELWRNGGYGADGRGGGSSPGGILQFPVQYLGSVPVEGTTTALQDLQLPLRTLYSNFLSGRGLMEGQLAITAEGLRFEAPRLRLVNPFTTIAVWAAIKFVVRGEAECAFMPLISDPEGQDKGRLFSRMEAQLAETYLGVLKGGPEASSFRNPPIFACVMREASFSLDCHAFACKCAEDAIVVAANLYQSLVDKMRTVSKEGLTESGYGSLNRTSPNTNSKRPCSSGSSVTCPPEGGRTGSCSSTSGNLSAPPPNSEPPPGSHRVIFSDSESLVPVRPPRRKKKHLESGNLKRYNSEDSVLLKMPTRRKSFKGNHASSRPHYVKNKKRVHISTPEETSSADSVNESIDQVLDRIISPGGMSFNDLKPSYQELILKIALTLTQDQLYQKSKDAMKKQQGFQKKDGKAEVGEEPSQFLGNFLKPFSKIASGRVSSGKGGLGGKFGISPLNGNAKHKVPKVILKKRKKEAEEPFMSFCSGCVCENCSEKCYCSLPSKHGVKILGLPVPSSTAASTCPSEGTTCKAASTTNTEPGKKVCGYDSESCAESEKCYCSLQGVKSNGLKVYNINLDTETSDTDTNSYDLEPFNDGEEGGGEAKGSRSVEILSYHPSKRLAYSLAPPHLTTTSALVHFEEETKGKVPGGFKAMAQSTENPSSSAYSQVLEAAQNRNSKNSPSQRQRNKVLLITGSSPSTQVIYKDHPYSFHTRLSQEQGMAGASMVVSGNGCGKVQRSLGDITEDDDLLEEDLSLQNPKGDVEDNLEPEKVLSMKKTAEIAAMFNNMRLDKGCDAAKNQFPVHQKKVEKTQNLLEESLDFEASLGYLP